MTFSEAAVAYELQQSGCSFRYVAKLFGVSKTHLIRVIRQCLEFGKAAPLLDAKKTGRPRQLPVKVIKRAMVMRDMGLAFDSIGKVLALDPEQLRKAVWHYDNQAK